ncbi:glycosyltransferase [Caenibacillus caldisaponilyticus]|uniref:glycosyltransferase n=1 Tax=Caenibacillus caldisaponilyticus TaxID=1674942 RepID=UPI0009884908|nr:glycosyltransferase [Caenibacillus caldisaponilyticus]
MAALGVREDRIDVTGIPIHPKFLKTYNRAALMEKYGLQPGVPTLIFTGGGYGLMDGNHSLVHLVDQLPLSLQTVIVCGHNKPLFRRLSEQAKRAQHRFLIIGYTEHMEELMAVADVMVTKAGGLTTAEALAVTLPMIVYPLLRRARARKPAISAQEPIRPFGRQSQPIVGAHRAIVDRCPLAPGIDP